MRRLIHVVLLVFIVLGVRAFGGTTETEDGLGIASRWMAEKTGLKQATEMFNTSLRPRIEAVTRSTSSEIYRAVSRVLSGQTGVGWIVAWIADEVDGAASQIESSIRSKVSPNAADTPPPVKEDSTGGR